MNCKRCGKLLGYEETLSEYCYTCQQDNDKINRLTNIGHTHHCSYRLVWGDGICECGGNHSNTKQEKRERLEVIAKYN